MASIGCDPEYTALIARQPGQATNQQNQPHIIGELSEIIRTEWGRTQNTPSNGLVTITSCPTNCQLLNQIDAWAYEMWLYRDTKFAWGGPVLIRRDLAGTITIQAADVTAYANRRTITTGYTNTDDPADIAESLAIEYFPNTNTDPQFWANMSTIGHPPDPITVTYDPYQYTVGEKWADMVTAGMRYTTLGRYTFIYGPTAPNYTSPYLIDATDIIGELELIQDGTNFATRVTGLGEGIATIIGPTSTDLAYYGLIDLPPVKFQGITDTTQLTNLTQQLYDRHNTLQPQLVIPEGSALAAGTEIINQGTDIFTFTQIALEDLIPGLRYDVQIGDTHCTPGIYPMQLTELKVTWTPEQQESINVSLTNLGPPPE